MVHPAREAAVASTSKNLNTSYVMVHPSIRNYHQQDLAVFKYILCYGSSKIKKVIKKLHINLNTSYVMVHLPVCVLCFWFDKI